MSRDIVSYGLIEMSTAKKFGCVECGKTFEVYPPDDEHTIALFRKPSVLDSRGSTIPMTYVCKNKKCGHKTTLYWSSSEMPESDI